MVAAVLHLGQLSFERFEQKGTSDPGSALAPSCAESTAAAAELLGCTVDALTTALCEKRVLKERSPRTPREAAVARDALAKAAYERLFADLISIVNTALYAEAAERQRELFVGYMLPPQPSAALRSPPQPSAAFYSLPQPSTGHPKPSTAFHRPTHMPGPHLRFTPAVHTL